MFSIRFKIIWYSLIAKVRRLFRRQRELYVGPGGDDLADGRHWRTRRLTLGAIEEIVQPGDTVWVIPHPNAGMLYVTHSGKVNAPITYIATDSPESSIPPT